MLNTQLNNWWLNTNIAPILWWVNSWVIDWTIWADSAFDKYSFIEIIDWIEIQTITLSDFLTNWSKWIYVIDSNIRETPEKTFEQYNNPFSDWWQIFSERNTEKEVTMTLWIVTSGINSLEATISNLKSVFDSGWKLQFNHNWVLRALKVISVKSAIKEIKMYRAELDVTLLSVSPFFESEEKIKTVTSLSWDSQIWLSLFETERNIYINTQLILSWITWTIDSASIEYNWYTVTYNWPLVSWDVLEFNWKDNSVVLNSVKVTKYWWQFTQLSKNKQNTINIWFTWTWTVDNYNTYILYNNLFL